MSTLARQLQDMNNSFPYRVVFLTGVDGCGKSFFAQRLMDVLKARGLPVIHVWSRFNNYFSKPLLAIARVMGLNYYEARNGVKVGYHDFEGRPIISFLFIWLQLFDVWIASIIKFWVPLIRQKAIIISDRGPHDTLIDVALDTGRDDLPKSIVGKLYSRAIPFSDKILFVNRDVEKIEASRPDVKSDRKFSRRLNIYLKNEEAMDFCRISNNGTTEETMSQILAELFDEKKENSAMDI